MFRSQLEAVKESQFTVIIETQSKLKHYLIEFVKNKMVNWTFSSTMYFLLSR